MDDRELLELAARAGGAEHSGYRGSEPLYSMPVETEGGTEYLRWNPLTDDGDALRLAARLRLDVTFSRDEVWVNWVSPTDCRFFKEPYGEDRMAAARRSITRAAADIERAMP